MKYSGSPLIFRSFLSSWWGKQGWQTDLFINFALVYGDALWFSGFQDQQKMHFPVAKLSCYLPFYIEVDLVNTELKLWIKLWLETSFVYPFMTI